jgi:hypothetical protein
MAQYRYNVLLASSDAATDDGDRTLLRLTTAVHARHLPRGSRPCPSSWHWELKDAELRAAMQHRLRISPLQGSDASA